MQFILFIAAVKNSWYMKNLLRCICTQSNLVETWDSSAGNQLTLCWFGVCGSCFCFHNSNYLPAQIKYFIQTSWSTMLNKATLYDTGTTQSNHVSLHVLSWPLTAFKCHLCFHFYRDGLTFIFPLSFTANQMLFFLLRKCYICIE